MYRRVKNNELNQELINISEQVLNKYKNQPIGSEFHFQYNNQNYKAVFEEHSNSPNGVSLFVEENKLNPQQEALQSAFSDYLRQKNIRAANLGEGLKILEQQLGRAISYVMPNVSPSVVNGMIWQGDHINPNTSPSDIEAALETLKGLEKYKQAQADPNLVTVEQIENPPLATKFVPTKEDTKLETGEKQKSQQIGISTNVAPKEEAIDEENLDNYLYQNMN